jgi:hypothetical protein
MKITEQTDLRLVIKHSFIFVYLFLFIFIFAGFYVSFIFNEAPIWFGLAFILIPLIIMFLIPRVVITFDKVKNELKIVTKRLYAKQITEKYNLSDVRKIKIYSSTHMGKNGLKKSYELIVEMNNQDISLNRGISTTTSGILVSFMKPNEVKVGEKVATFLGVDFRMEKSPSFHDVKRTVQDSIAGFKN